MRCSDEWFRVPALEVLIVMNSEPDVAGYPEKQIQLLKQFQEELTKELGAAQVEKRLGIYTVWSCNEKKPKYEIMPIYVHSKVAIVDDIWATIGSANLDGASLNQIELDTIVQGTLANAVGKGNVFKRILARGDHGSHIAVGYPDRPGNQNRAVKTVSTCQSATVETANPLYGTQCGDLRKRSRSRCPEPGRGEFS